MLQLAFLIYLETTRLNTRPGQKRYYLWLLLITFLSFAADMMSSIEATSGVFLIMSAAGNYLEISLNTLLIPVFYRYLCDRIFNLNVKIKHAMDYILWTLTVFVVGLVLSTAVTGWIFYYDDAGTYHRGPLFPLLMITFFVMMVLVEGFLISQKRKTSRIISVRLSCFSPHRWSAGDCNFFFSVCRSRFSELRLLLWYSSPIFRTAILTEII